MKCATLATLTLLIAGPAEGKSRLHGGETLSFGCRIVGDDRVVDTFGGAKLSQYQYRDGNLSPVYARTMWYNLAARTAHQGSLMENDLADCTGTPLENSTVFSFNSDAEGYGTQYTRTADIALAGRDSVADMWLQLSDNNGVQVACCQLI